MEKAYRYRFYPTPEQESLLRRTLGCVRLVYNKALHERTVAWYERQERVGYTRTSSLLTEWKKREDLDFLNDVSCVPLQQGLRHLQTAFSNFFAGQTDYPKFKKKHRGGSAEFTRSAFKFKDGQITLAKCLEPLAIRWSRRLPPGCEPSTVTVRSHPDGRWHLSIRFDDPTVKPLPALDKVIGIDPGIGGPVITSDGEKISNPPHLRKYYRKLRRLQKKLARKQKDSKNREKARSEIGRIQAKITDSRADHLHKLTTRLVRENQTIIVERIALKNTIVSPNSFIGRGDITRQLAYKCRWYGRNYIEIDRFFPNSERCHNCGYIVEKIALNIREWDCPNCGTHHDRYINASKNILAAGLAVSVCGATVRPEQSKSVKAGARKQKPKS